MGSVHNFKSSLKARDKHKKQAVHGLGRVQRTTVACQHLDALLRRAPVPNARNAVPIVPADGAARSDVNMVDWIDVEEPLSAPSLPSLPPPPRDRAGSAL